MKTLALLLMSSFILVSCKSTNKEMEVTNDESVSTELESTLFDTNSVEIDTIIVDITQ
jgi:uncharacterized protein YcfL